MHDEPDKPDDMDVLLRAYAAERRKFAQSTPDAHEADIRMLTEQARREHQQRRATHTGFTERWKLIFSSLSTPRWAVIGATAVILLFLVLWLPTRRQDNGNQPVASTVGEIKAPQPEPVTPPTPQPVDPARIANQKFSMAATYQEPGAAPNLATVPDKPKEPKFHAASMPEDGGVAAGFHNSSEKPPATVKTDYGSFDLAINLGQKVIALKFTDGTLLTGKLEISADMPMSYTISATGTNPTGQTVALKGVLIAIPDPAKPGQAKEVGIRGVLTMGNREIQLTARPVKP